MTRLTACWRWCSAKGERLTRRLRVGGADQHQRHRDDDGAALGVKVAIRHEGIVPEIHRVSIRPTPRCAIASAFSPAITFRRWPARLTRLVARSLRQELSAR